MAAISSLTSQAVKLRIAKKTPSQIRRGTANSRYPVTCQSWQAFETSASSAETTEDTLVHKLAKSAVAVSAVASILCGNVSGAIADVELKTYYGTAASASSYGGYGGNASKIDTAEYVYLVPSDWKERNISKVEKGTNGTDSEFFNPKKRAEKTYSLFLAGFRKLPPIDNVLNDIALSDVDLQDLIGTADDITATKRKVEESGQMFYDFEIDSPLGHALISVTCAKNKLYAHFVVAPNAEWSRDSEVLRQIHDSFTTVGRDPLAPSGVF